MGSSKPSKSGSSELTKAERKAARAVAVQTWLGEKPKDSYWNSEAFKQKQKDGSKNRPKM